MEWHVNDISLNGQFPGHLDFRRALEPLLRLRLNDPYLRANLYSSRVLSDRQVTATENLRQAVQLTRDKTFISLVLAWLGKSGPFWEDARQVNADDYFEFNGEDVTDQGLGEATRRRLVERVANTFSFSSESGFEQSPLSVQHGLREEPLGFIDVDNHWTLEQLAAELQNHRTVNSWVSLDAEIRRRFLGLVFSDDVLDPFRATPFSSNVAKRTLELLGTLEEITIETGSDGGLSSRGKEILTNHFSSEKGWFSDESLQNKKNFSNEMTFTDPEQNTNELFCSWHGKIKTPQSRIHFEWPRPKGQKTIKIPYIGPKITKR